MKIIPYLMTLLLIHCFMIYTKDESILQSYTIDSKIQKEKKDMFILAHTLTKDGLYLLLDGYQVEEENQVNFIKEKYRENKAVKFKNFFEKGIGGCDVYFCGAILVIAVTVMALEITTLPFRTMTEPQERIQKELKLLRTNTIGVLSTEGISILLLETRPPKEYMFQQSKTFIPISELYLDSYNVNKFRYKIFYNNTKELILEGFIDMSEDVLKNKEIQALINEYDNKNPSGKCKSIFPILENMDINEETATRESREICKHKYAKPNILIWNNLEYNQCLESIKNCYSITRYSK